jgi:1-acyl-sn-glycerol-3-phosphate acyltransferase
VEEWKLAPARDLGLAGLQRSRSVWRESGLVESVARLASWGCLRAALRLLNRMKVHGRENLPRSPSFVMAANHASHLDALVLGAALPLAWRDHIFPMAAGDVFFEDHHVAALATTLLNALPVWRRNAGCHGVKDLRRRLVEEPCIYILFPEGGRSRDGQMHPFKSGIGMMTAETPVPVVPCHLRGTFEAFPPGRHVPRPHRIEVRIGEPLTFATTPNTREGWDEVGRAVEEAVRRLAATMSEPRTQR